MKLRQTLVFDVELDPAGRVHLDDVNEFPWNHTCRYLPRDRLQRLCGQRALKEPANSAPETNFHFTHTQVFRIAVMRKPLQIDIVDADHLTAMNIDDLPVEQILA